MKVQYMFVITQLNCGFFHMSIPFALHVGMSKTATTTMQEGLFSHHPDIAYIGKSLKSKAPKKCKNVEVYDAFKPALWSHDDGFNARHASQVGRSLLASDDPPRKIVLGSWEEFGSHPDRDRLHKTLSRLSESFTPCKALFVIRNPVKWAPSEYMQKLRWHYYRACERPIGYRTFIDFDSWWKNVDRYAKGSGLFSYGPNLQAAVEVLGVKNVGVLLYEELVADINSFSSSLASFLCISNQGVRELLETNHRNARMTESQFKLLEDINKSSIHKFVWRMSSVRLRRKRFKMVINQSNGDVSPAKFSLDADQVARVAERTKDMNVWIRDTFGLPLSKYGYPL